MLASVTRRYSDKDEGGLLRRFAVLGWGGDAGATARQKVADTVPAVSPNTKDDGDDGVSSVTASTSDQIDESTSGGGSGSLTVPDYEPSDIGIHEQTERDTSSMADRDALSMIDRDAHAMADRNDPHAAPLPYSTQSTTLAAPTHAGSDAQSLPIGISPHGASDSAQDEAYSTSVVSEGSLGPYDRASIVSATPEISTTSSLARSMSSTSVRSAIPSSEMQTGLPNYDAAAAPPDATPAYQDSFDSILPSYSCSIYREAIVPRKLEMEDINTPATSRSWHLARIILCGTMLEVYRGDGSQRGQLIRRFSLAYGQIGLASDYSKRPNCVRVRVENVQFLMQLPNPMDAIAWVEAVQCGFNVALDLDEMNYPYFASLVSHRRRRHPHRTAAATRERGRAESVGSSSLNGSEGAPRNGDAERRASQLSPAELASRQPSADFVISLDRTRLMNPRAMQRQLLECSTQELYQQHQRRRLTIGEGPQGLDSASSTSLFARRRRDTVATTVPHDTPGAAEGLNPSRPIIVSRAGLAAESARCSTATSATTTANSSRRSSLSFGGSSAVPQSGAGSSHRRGNDAAMITALRKAGVIPNNKNTASEAAAMLAAADAAAAADAERAEKSIPCTYVGGEAILDSSIGSRRPWPGLRGLLGTAYERTHISILPADTPREARMVVQGVLYSLETATSTSGSKKGSRKRGFSVPSPATPAAAAAAAAAAASASPPASGRAELLANSARSASFSSMASLNPRRNFQRLFSIGSSHPAGS